MTTLHKSSGEIKSPKRSPVHYLQFYPGPWRNGTSRMTLEQEGLYVRICAYRWDADELVPLDRAEAARLLRINRNKYEKLITELIAFGKIVETENGLINERAELEYQRAKSATQKAATRKTDPGHARETCSYALGHTPTHAMGHTHTHTPTHAPPVDDEKAEQNQGPLREKDKEEEKEKKEERIVGAIFEKTAEPELAALLSPKPAQAKMANSRGSRLAEDFVMPAEWIDWTRVNCPASMAESTAMEALKFANYWQAMPGTKGRKIDWKKTWQNWSMTCFSRAPLRPAATVGATKAPWVEAKLAGQRAALAYCEKMGYN